MRITKEQFEQVVKNSYCKAEVARQLGWSDNGATQKKVSNYISEYGVSTEHFLSKREARNLSLFGNANGKYVLVSKICPVCDKSFETRAGHDKEKTVCSRGCANTLFRSGQNHGNYIHGRNNEPEYRVICFEYWDRVCAIPGCEWDKVLEVHHVDGNHKNNNPKNLIPLCANHHKLTVTLKYKEEIDALIEKLIQAKFQQEVST